LIEAIECCLLAGEHMIALGPPGTGKSMAIRYFAGAAGLGFFRKVLNPDTTRDELVGPIDPHAFKEGRWDRKWAGLATCDVAFLDEPGKASGQVLNMMLDIMEERKVVSGDVDRDIPIHLIMSASNETIDESPAIWDRYTVRLVVSRLADAGGFNRLLKTAWQASDPPSIEVLGDELRGARAVCLDMAEAAANDPAVSKAMVRLWLGIGDHVSEKPSDRRWLRVLVVAAGHALLAGRVKVQVADLEIARWILWCDIDERAAVAGFIKEIIDEDRKMLLTATALVGELETMSAGWVGGGDPMSAENLADAAKVLYRVENMLTTTRANAQNGGSDGWGGLVVRLEKIKEATG